MFGCDSFEWIWSSVTNYARCQLSNGDDMTILTHLLRQLRRLHLRLDDLERDHLSGRSAAIVSLGLVTDGETSLSQSVSCGIIDSAWLCYYRWRRIRMH